MEFVKFELDISDLLKLICHTAEFHSGFTLIYCPQKLKTSAFIKDLSGINHVLNSYSLNGIFVPFFLAWSNFWNSVHLLETILEISKVLYKGLNNLKSYLSLTVSYIKV